MATILLTILFLILLLFLPTILHRRATTQVIALFRKHQAVGKDNAKAVAEIGLSPPSFSRRLLGLRDYKPRALDALIAVHVVKVTEAGKMYLSEENLMNMNP